MQKKFQSIIVGSGFSGIGAAVELQKKGITDYLMIERHSELGGTWYINRYPGAQVDVDSHLYSMSGFGYDWTRRFATRDEILDYTRMVIKQNHIESKAVTNCNVTRVEYNESTGEWLVSTSIGEFVCNDLILACGHLSNAYIPKFSGLDTFKGKVVHTMHWDPTIEYKNKKVAVIGTGASGIQVVPGIANDVSRLDVFQRTPHYITQRHDAPIPEWKRSLFKQYPLLRQLYRYWLYWSHEYRVVAFAYFPFLLSLVGGKKAQKYLNTIKDPVLRQKMTPDFPIGCKRVLLSDDFYAAFERSNVVLHTDFKQIVPNGVELKSGELVESDLIILATGFEAFRHAERVFTFPVIGKKGISLSGFWSEHGIKAYLSSTVPNFPNLYMLNGPNSGIGHTSAIFMAESQLKYVINAIFYRSSQSIKAVELKHDVWARYNERLIERMKKSVWSAGCQSWYQAEDGSNPSIYPDFTFKYYLDCKFKVNEHVFV